MTDFEMTKLCAEAMEPAPTLPGRSSIWGVTIEYTQENGKKVSTWVRNTYNPLLNDVQAMALVKKLRLNVTVAPEGCWTVFGKDDPLVHCADVNRAIVECVATMRKAKIAE